MQNSLTIFTQEQKNDICRVLAGILHLGNIKFVAKDGVAKSIENEGSNLFLIWFPLDTIILLIIK